MNFKRKRARKQTVGCPCCHIPKDNSAERTKPKDRLTPEEIAIQRGLNKITNYPVNHDPIERKPNILTWDGEGPEPW